MELEYSVELCRSLANRFQDQKLHRPMRTTRYENGTRLSYDVTAVAPAHPAQVNLEIEKFVGGGFAGQVYRVKILDIKHQEENKGNLPTDFPLQIGGIYAMKILIPPSGFSLFFRNLLYRIGFQAPFQLQVNPRASRSGALWQKFIRRGAKARFGDQKRVNDIHVTFTDHTLGSCGEISDWVDGRTWLLEVDDRMDLLKRFFRRKKRRKKNTPDPSLLGSPEYRAKKQFMADFVTLLHDMGAHEFARQYEWSTAKSQPNCLKRHDSEGDPTEGLTAVDFRAGLVLLPFLPMSPGDFKLIFKGLLRGSLVQFDRGNLKRLEEFIRQHPEEFRGTEAMLEELKASETDYRNAIPDITHNHFRLLFSKRLWSGILESTRVGWRVRNITGSKTDQKLRNSVVKTFFFYVLGAIPFLGGFIRRLWARPDWRKHYGSLLSRWGYFKRAMRGKCLEKAIAWHRAGRLTAKKTEKIGNSTLRCFFHLPFSLLPVGLHRLFTDGAYARARLWHFFIRPIKLYFSAPLREQWLRDMVAQGEAKNMLNAEDSRVIRSQLNEPFIQKYLKSLAVHVCTLPVTQVVSIIVSWIYVKMHPELSYTEAMAAVAAILVLFQITPISPGSLVRGLYVVFLVIKDRNFRDYNIAVFLGFFKYIGYLAFPIQMTYRYPELARFMATHWATEAVHMVPVFGERGALLEHWVFRLFYNWPLTIRGRMRRRAELRATQKPRYWHLYVYALLAAGLLTGADVVLQKRLGALPGLSDNWWIALLTCLLGGAVVTLGCRGAALSRRLVASVIWALLTALFYSAGSALWIRNATVITGDMVTAAAWLLFLFPIWSILSAIITELRLGDPEVH